MFLKNASNLKSVLEEKERNEMFIWILKMLLKNKETYSWTLWKTLP